MPQYKWHIEVWVPHPRTPKPVEDVFFYHVDSEDVAHMRALCQRALADFDKKYPDYAGQGCIAGTFAYDQYFSKEDLLANHPEDWTHHREGCDLCP